MVKTPDVHLQFASYFPDENIWPFIYNLSQKICEGNICVDISETNLSNLPDYFKGEKIDSNSLDASSFIGNENNINQPFILHYNKLYFQRYFKYETIIIDKIRQIVESECSLIEQRIQFLQNNVSQLLSLFSFDKKEINWQFVACVLAYLHQFFILTGGPGTGKTTTIAKMLQWMISENENVRIGLTAPTGKAAVRMAESLNNASKNMSDALQTKMQTLQPQTIHRLLGSKKNSLYFKYNADNFLPYDILIVDECSMVDTALFAKFLSAIGPNTKVILLGDKNQLASVEAGSIFGDLCKIRENNNCFSDKISTLFSDVFKLNISKKTSDASILQDHITELEKSHRFNSEMGIGKLSRAVIENNQSLLNDFFDKAELEFEVKIDADYSISIFESFISDYSAYILEKDILTALHKLDSLRVLCAVREGANGTIAKNIEIKDYLIKKGLLSRNSDNEFYENRPIIVTQNNYDLNLYNGDIGIIREGKAWFVDASSENGVRSVNPALISAMDTVFAMTIHKSQGSEFKKVCMVLPQKETHNLITRELIYTGITRAKDYVLVQANKELFLQSCSFMVNRVSGIKDRL